MPNCPQVDLKGAIEAGIPFCKAANGVVLSEGPIPTRFVHRVKASTLSSAGHAVLAGHVSVLRSAAHASAFLGPHTPFAETGGGYACRRCCLPAVSVRAAA